MDNTGKITGWRLSGHIRDLAPRRIGQNRRGNGKRSGGASLRIPTNMFTDSDIANILSENKDNYELSCQENDPFYDHLKKAVEITKRFIIKKSLVIYGGTAIDYALRLKGSKIYPDEALSVPDLDFYSPDNVKHAQELADEFYNAGFSEARAIVATHVTTMRVDIGQNHFMADISYMPKAVFDRIEYIEYDGMRVFSPLMQRIDLHSSLAFPYDNAPMEVALARWHKDVKRFNLFEKYYPVGDYINSSGFNPEQIRLTRKKVSLKCLNFFFTGFMAYTLYYRLYQDILARYMKANIISGWDKDEAKNISNQILSADFVVHDDYFEVEVLEDVEFLINGTSKLDQYEYTLYGKKYFAPILPMSNHYTLAGKDEQYNTEVRFIILKNRLLSILRVQLADGLKLKVVNIQYVLMYFLSKYFVSNIMTSNTAGEEYGQKIYLMYYLSLLNMIRHVEILLTNLGENAKDNAFFLSYSTYGNRNLSESHEIIIERTIANYEGRKFDMPKPSNYWPKVAREKNSGHQSFDYESSPFYARYGQEVTDQKIIDSLK